ncbi:coiled-coil domain-containing protein 152-like [Dromaius novaehollandiae]|uniref:coiled-coil domain-containing protein 152-like n=1 Tax=Dromaius novaehollandiae TaxID=8790 RepID=UPI00311FA3E4
MKNISLVNLGKLLDDFSVIEKKISEINEANNLLVLQLEKSNMLVKLSQSKEDSVKEGNNLLAARRKRLSFGHLMMLLFPKVHPSHPYRPLEHRVNHHSLRCEHF